MNNETSPMRAGHEIPTTEPDASLPQTSVAAPALDILAVALEWFRAGYAPVPTKPDGSKAPAVNWARYNRDPITEADIRRDFQVDSDGIGLITGDASRGLEMLEVEARGIEYLDQLDQIVADHGAAELW